MSPEVIRGGAEGHDFSVDWWSVGVLTYELLTGASPFTVDGERNTQAEISKRILKNQPPIPEHLSAQARDFIKRLLVKEPSQRLGGGQSDASQLKTHPFLASINWTLLAQRRLKAPFKPKIRHELDVSNFAEEFTSMAPHVLDCSTAPNQINPSSSTLTTNPDSSIDSSNTDSEPVRPDDDDDYYESDDESENSDDFSKLFRGYSYINPKAIEWFKKQERRCLAGYDTSSLNKSFDEIAYMDTSICLSATKQAQDLNSSVSPNEPKIVFMRKAAKAVPIKTTTFENSDESDDNNHVFNDNNSDNLRVAFTIGDGEDLATAFRSAGNANKPSPMRLVIFKRKPSLELLYERLVKKRNIYKC